MRALLFGLALTLTCAGGRAWADLIGHGGMVRAIDVSPDGKWVVTGSFDYTARLWDFGSQTTVHVLDGHRGPVTGARFFPGGKRVITTSDDASAIIWDVATGKLLHRLEGHAGKVMAAAVSPDGKVAATAGWDRTLRLWDTATGRALRTIETKSPVNDVVFVKEGQWLAAGDHEGKITLWSVADGQPLGVLEGHRRGITHLAVTADGRVLSAGIDRTLRLWDVAGFKQVKTLVHSEARDGQVYAADVSPDGARALSAGRDGRLVLWDLAQGVAVRTIVTGEKTVWAARFTPDGRFALTAGADGNATVWHLDTGDRIGLTAGADDSPKPWLTSDHPGAKLFSKCAMCHALDAHATARSGPHFQGLWGRRVGAVSGYNYSEALKNANFTWNAKTLFELFDEGPNKFLPGTKMPAQRVPDKAQLDALVDYLRILTGPQPEKH